MARFLIFLVLAGSLSCVCTPDLIQAQNAADKQTIHLFNGKNLDGFYTFLKDRGQDNDPKKVFTVQDGILRISGEEWGCITTKKEYENYHLIAEFKWGEIAHPPRADKARDSGILLHSVGEDGAYAGYWLFSIECQVIEGGTGDLLVVGDKSDAYALTANVAEQKKDTYNQYQKDGKPVTVHDGRINWFARDPAWQDVKGFRGAADVEKPVGEWNRLECIAKGDKITIILNGVTVNECFDTKPSKGKIQLQSEGAEIFFRKLDLIPLKP